MAENETPLTEQGYSPKELLAQVDKALTAVMVGGQSYKIGSRSLTRANLTELRRLRADLAAQVAGEVRDDSLEALDKLWEEEAVDFLQAEQQDRCPSQTTMPGKAREEVPVPLHWIDFKQDGAASAPAQEALNETIAHHPVAGRQTPSGPPHPAAVPRSHLLR